MGLEYKLEIEKRFKNTQSDVTVRLFAESWVGQDALNLIVTDNTEQEGVAVVLTENQVKDFIEVLKAFVVEPEGEEGDDEHR